MKRIAVGLTWTFVLMWAGDYVALYAGLPAIVLAFVALAIGAFIAVDPLRLVWAKAVARPAQSTTTSTVTTERLART